MQRIQRSPCIAIRATSHMEYLSCLAISCLTCIGVIIIRIRIGVTVCKWAMVAGERRAVSCSAGANPSFNLIVILGVDKSNGGRCDGSREDAC